MDNPNQQLLAELLMNTGQAHHQAFIETDGEDPEWAIWYADYLQEKLPALLGHQLTKSRMVYEFVWMAENIAASEEHWTKAYARELLKKYP